MINETLQDTANQILRDQGGYTAAQLDAMEAAKAAQAAYEASDEGVAAAAAKESDLFSQSEEARASYLAFSATYAGPKTAKRDAYLYGIVSSLAGGSPDFSGCAAAWVAEGLPGSEWAVDTACQRI